MTKVVIIPYSGSLVLPNGKLPSKLPQVEDQTTAQTCSNIMLRQALRNVLCREFLIGFHSDGANKLDYIF